MSDEKPTGLPKIKKEDPNKPTGLPEIQVSERAKKRSHLQENMNKARMCPHCGKEGRIVSNQNGVNGFCGPCKRHWPVTSAPLMPESPLAPARGFHKTTVVDPDWNIAFDKDIES